MTNQTVHLFCEEAFILQQLQKLKLSKEYIIAMNLIEELELDKAEFYISENLKTDEKGFRSLLKASFSLKGESNKDYYLRRSALLEKSLLRKNCIAQFVKAGMLEDSISNESDFRTIIDLYKSSAAELFPPSMRELGIIKFYGRGCEVSVEEALKLISQAASLGDELSKDFLVNHSKTKF